MNLIVIAHSAVPTQGSCICTGLVHTCTYIHTYTLHVQLYDIHKRPIQQPILHSMFIPPHPLSLFVVQYCHLQKPDFDSCIFSERVLIPHSHASMGALLIGSIYHYAQCTTNLLPRNNQLTTTLPFGMTFLF